jgi:hypothetical protein
MGIIPQLLCGKGGKSVTFEALHETAYDEM